MNIEKIVNRNQIMSMMLKTMNHKKVVEKEQLIERIQGDSGTLDLIKEIIEGKQENLEQYFHHEDIIVATAASLRNTCNYAYENQRDWNLYLCRGYDKVHGLLHNLEFTMRILKNFKSDKSHYHIIEEILKGKYLDPEVALRWINMNNFDFTYKLAGNNDSYYKAGYARVNLFNKRILIEKLEQYIDKRYLKFVSPFNIMHELEGIKRENMSNREEKMIKTVIAEHYRRELYYDNEDKYTVFDQNGKIIKELELEDICQTDKKRNKVADAQLSFI